MCLSYGYIGFFGEWFLEVFFRMVFWEFSRLSYLFFRYVGNCKDNSVIVVFSGSLYIRTVLLFYMYYSFYFYDFVK